MPMLRRVVDTLARSPVDRRDFGRNRRPRRRHASARRRCFEVVFVPTAECAARTVSALLDAVARRLPDPADHRRSSASDGGNDRQLHCRLDRRAGRSHRRTGDAPRPSLPPIPMRAAPFCVSAKTASRAAISSAFAPRTPSRRSISGTISSHCGRSPGGCSRLSARWPLLRFLTGRSTSTCLRDRLAAHRRRRTAHPPAFRRSRRRCRQAGRQGTCRSRS